MSIYIVQSTNTAQSVATTIAFTLSGAPVVGNILLAFTAYSLAFGNPNVTAPDGTWTKYDDTTLSNVGLSTWTKTVVAGNGTSYVFSASGGSQGEYASGVLFEVSGALVVPNKHGINSINSATYVSPSLVPSVLETQAIAAVSTDAGSANAISLTSVSSGWTAGLSGIPPNHAIFTATRNAITADTVTGVSCTFVVSGASNGVTANILLHPAPVVVAVPSGTPVDVPAFSPPFLFFDTGDFGSGV